MRPIIRHQSAPTVNGCRRCGSPCKDHGWRWAGGNVHRFVPPTFAQRAARLAAHLTAREALRA